MMPPIALLDANVLYPAPLRDLLMQLAFDGLYQARWSVEIGDEWKRNLLANRPDLDERIDRTQAAMLRVLPDALVSDYASLIPDLVLPDPDDRHVLAAAITAEAETIVTFNLRDFPPEALGSYGLVAQHPDAFLGLFIAAVPSHVLSGVRECIARLTRPPVTADGYLAILRRLRLSETAEFLAENLGDWQP